MPTTQDQNKSTSGLHIMDALMYTLAGSAMLIISVSFLLWLRF
jgi:hypothetical protein